MSAIKTSWPECVGKTGEVAKSLVQADQPNFLIEFLGPMDPCTMDYRTDRVRIFIDNNTGKVTEAPMIG